MCAAGAELCVDDGLYRRGAVIRSDDELCS